MGFTFKVYKQSDEGTSPATFESPEGHRLAAWETCWEGIRWIDDLVKEGKAFHIGGDVDTFRITATAEHIIPQLVKGPPWASENWTEFTPRLAGWRGWIRFDRLAAETCRPDEWLLIVVWDLN